jgi:peptide/nickel transport system permease protein
MSKTISRWRTPLKDFWRRYRKNRAAVAGMILLCFFVILAVLAPLFSPFDPLRMVGPSFSRPGGNYLMGTDDLGRDVYSGVLYGARASILVGFLAAATSTLIGVFIGALSGYYGGRFDDVLMRITEIFLIIPQLFLALILVALFGPSVWNVIFVIGILAWPGTARLVRSEFLSLKEQVFVEAARALGAGNRNILFDEILPNVTSPIIVSGSLQVARAILVEASLSFLGLGDPSISSWGIMLSNAQRFIRHAWWMSFFPGLSIFLLVIGLNLIGDGLNDALNPRLKEK